MTKTIFRNVICGLIVGASMLIPGMSGGTMGIILGIYDDLIRAISSITSRKNIRKNLFFLLQFGIGSVTGIALFSGVVLNLVNSFRMPMMFLFMGVILGTLPTLYRKARSNDDGEKIKFRLSDIVYVLIGLGICVAIMFIPTGFINFSGGFSLINLLIIIVAGLVIAIALVLPGISCSQMLLLLGVYELTLRAVKEFNFGFLIPLVLSVLVGTLLTTRVLENAMNKHPRGTYLLIIGFVAASLFDVFPGVPTGIEWVICPITFIVGIVGILCITGITKGIRKD